MKLNRVAALVLLVLLCAGRTLADGPIRVIELKGEPAGIGQQHGQQLGPDIRILHEKYLKAFFRDPGLYKQALLGAFIFRNQLLPEHRSELLALAQSSKVDSGDMMLGNCFLDMLPMTLCSTVSLPGDASIDGTPRMGRNLDFPGLDIADKYSVLLVVKPTGRYAFAAISWPGLIGVLSGMNEHGLVLCNMEVHREMRTPSAMPYTLLYRTVLEQCRTVDEAVALLNKTPRQSANNLMLMDADGRRAAVELTPDGVTVRDGIEHEALVSTNHQRGQNRHSAGQCRRYDFLDRTAQAQYGKLDVGSIEKMLGGAAQGKMTLQSMVFEPTTRTLYLATGTEATKREYQRIELGPLFR